MARGDIFVSDLPASDGREQSGRRPVIAVQIEGSSLPTLVVVPFSSRLEALRFPFTFRVDPSPMNGLSQSSVLLVFQLRAIDRIRLGATIGRLETQYLDKLNDEMRRMLGL